MVGNADGKRFMTCTSFAAATSQTILLAFSPSSLASTYLVELTSGAGLIENFTTGLVEYYNPSDRYTLASSPSAGVHVLAVSQVNGGALIGYFDGVQSFSHTATATNKTPIAIGYTAGSNGTNGDILELLVFTSALGASSIIEASDLLLRKWGTST
jgi:hypothetical protein